MTLALSSRVGRAPRAEIRSGQPCTSSVLPSLAHLSVKNLLRCAFCMKTVVQRNCCLCAVHCVVDAAVAVKPPPAFAEGLKGSGKVYLCDLSMDCF